eukprot:360087_1
MIAISSINPSASLGCPSGLIEPITNNPGALLLLLGIANDELHAPGGSPIICFFCFLFRSLHANIQTIEKQNKHIPSTIHNIWITFLSLFTDTSIIASRVRSVLKMDGVFVGYCWTR